MNKNIDESLKDLLVLEKLYELERLINENKKIDKKLLELEIDIIETALMYDKGDYKESEYITPYRAYSILLKCAKDTNEPSVSSYGIKIKDDIEKIINKNNYSISYLITFLKSLIFDFTRETNIINNEGENKLYGLL